MMLADYQNELAGLTDEQISNGLKHLPKGWPPEVKEFRELCTGVDESKAAIDKQAHTMLKPRVRSLPITEEARQNRVEIARRGKAECMKIIRGY